MSTTIEEVLATLQNFADERNWNPVHTPRNLSESVAIEAGELLECFQWGKTPDPEELKFEVADVLTYLFFLCNQLGLNPVDIVLEKLEITREKYPAS